MSTSLKTEGSIRVILPDEISPTERMRTVIRVNMLLNNRFGIHNVVVRTKNVPEVCYVCMFTRFISEMFARKVTRTRPQLALNPDGSFFVDIQTRGVEKHDVVVFLEKNFRVTIDPLVLQPVHTLRSVAA